MTRSSLATDGEPEAERVSGERPRARSKGSGAHTRPAKRVASTAYAKQLALLSRTYSRLRAADLTRLAGALQEARHRPTVYVGSGGALAVARLAADVHEAQAGSFARAATPLELLGMPSVAERAVVLFTASARHPDASAVASTALRSHARPAVVVTHRDRDELPAAFASPRLDVITLPSLMRREGFLATNSVLAMAAAVIGASDLELPEVLPHLAHDGVDAVRDNTVILSAPGLAPVGVDLETRLAETGLSGVQLTDYRNFAHGRHTGLARRLESTTVLALVTPPFLELAEATLAILPPSAHVIRLESRLPWPACVLDLLVASMKVVAVSAQEAGLDPSRPQVPEFGRRLYRMSSRRLVPQPRDPVDRKLEAMHVREATPVRAAYERALEEWNAAVRGEQFAGFVLDYDGTVCTTEGRFDLPTEPIRARLVELLDEGAIIGFASGRGGSLHRDLRAWIPRRRWSQVHLGLYNGGLNITLQEEVERGTRASGSMRDAAQRLRAMPLARVVKLVEREHQLGLELTKDSPLGLDGLRRVVQETLATPPAVSVKLVASGHSLDVIPTDSAKTHTVASVGEHAGGNVVAIGDQGQGGGNDFELLAATRWSLSVDRVSADPTRCWNLDRRGERGPELLLRYLKAFQRRRKGFAFRPKR